MWGSCAVVQDSEGFTPLMRLVQRGHRAEAEMLLACDDCNIHAQAAGTGVRYCPCSCMRQHRVLVLQCCAVLQMNQGSKFSPATVSVQPRLPGSNVNFMVFADLGRRQSANICAR
jgi:hypothetical protein